MSRNDVEATMHQMEHMPENVLRQVLEASEAFSSDRFLGYFENDDFRGALALIVGFAQFCYTLGYRQRKAEEMLASLGEEVS